MKATTITNKRGIQMNIEVSESFVFFCDCRGRIETIKGEKAIYFSGKNTENVLSFFGVTAKLSEVNILISLHTSNDIIDIMNEQKLAKKASLNMPKDKSDSANNLIFGKNNW